jgi:hypothetical protein
MGIETSETRWKLKILIALQASLGASFFFVVRQVLPELPSDTGLGRESFWQGIARSEVQRKGGSRTLSFLPSIRCEIRPLLTALRIGLWVDIPLSPGGCQSKCSQPLATELCRHVMVSLIVTAESVLAGKPYQFAISRIAKIDDLNHHTGHSEMFQ